MEKATLHLPAVGNLNQRSIFLVGRGPAGRTTTAQLISEVHGHRYVEGKAPRFLLDELVLYRDRSGPLVVDDLSRGDAFMALFRPERDVVVVLNREGWTSAAEDYLREVEQLAIRQMEQGTMSLHQYLTATFNSYSSPKLLRMQAALGLEAALRERGLWLNGH